MPAPPSRTVTLYGRPGCNLCDQAESILRALEPRLHFQTHVINIEEDDSLHRRFMLEIPVVEVGGEVIARAPISPHSLESSLREALHPPERGSP